MSKETKNSAWEILQIIFSIVGTVLFALSVIYLIDKVDLLFNNVTVFTIMVMEYVIFYFYTIYDTIKKRLDEKHKAD